MTLTTEDGKPCEGIDQGPFEPIAVIGLGALMPDAHDIDAFWQNILMQKSASKRCLKDAGPDPLTTFERGRTRAHTEGSPTPRSGHS